MVKLLLNNPEVASCNETSFGGRPVKNSAKAFSWPSCKYCELPMLFLGKIAADNTLYQIFMCQNDPGVCEEWDPNDGGNKVIITQAVDLEFVEPPEEGETTRNLEHSALIVDVSADNYEDARQKWAQENAKPLSYVLGQLQGTPFWVQGDETPECDDCGAAMQLLAQLEQGPDESDDMNFGGGCAYAFNCSCGSSAKFLWQC